MDLDGRFRPIALESAWFALFVGVTVVLTWPLARLLPVAVAWPGDPVINTYIISWDVHALATAPGELFHPKVLHPLRYGLTFSENLLGLWPLAAIILPFTTPLITHNLLLILGIAFSGYGAFVLGRTVTGSSAAGLVAGVAYGFCAWRLAHLAHLQHAWGGWLPLIVAAVVLYDRKPTWLRAAAVGVAFVLNGLTNLHYLVFALVLIAIILTALTVSSPERRRSGYLAPLGASVTAAILVLVAILWPYRVAHQLHGLRGDRVETTLYSASLSDWIRPADHDEPERNVFPGFTATVIAAAGLIMLGRRASGPPVWGLIAVASIAIGIYFSLGPRSWLYSSLFDHSALLRGIRAPARWAVLAYLGTAILAALAFRGRRRVFAVVASVLMLMEVSRGPLRWHLMPSQPDAVYGWLQDSAEVGAVLELPIGSRDVYYLAGAAIHHRPILNGVDGGAAPVHEELRTRFSQPSIAADTIEWLRRLGTSHIIVHVNALGTNADAVRRFLGDALRSNSLSYAGHFESGIFGDLVFSLTEAPRATDAALASFLSHDGTLPPNHGPFGYLEAPLPGDTPRGSLKIRGWALSGTGIRTARIWFANKTCFVDAALLPYPGLQSNAPFHSTDSARFAVDLDARPCGEVENDILVELIDHADRTATLPHVWIRWE